MSGLQSHRALRLKTASHVLTPSLQVLIYLFGIRRTYLAQELGEDKSYDRYSNYCEQ